MPPLPATAEWLDLWESAIVRASLSGGAALLIVWLLCRALPRVSPRVRCWLWRVAYLKLLASLLLLAPVELAVLPPVPASPAVSPAVVSRTLGAAPSSVRPARQPLVSEASSDRLPFSFGTVLPWGVVLWLAGVLWCLLRLGREALIGIRLRRACCPADDDGLLRCCAEICWRLAVPRMPAVLLAEGNGSPLLLGALHPAIVLPTGLLAECSEPELRLMLAHELAHEKRRDLLWAWLPALAHALFFFHPAVWLANREWRLAQEMACDELAVLMTDSPVGDYGEVLVKVAVQSRLNLAPSLATVGTEESPETLKFRLAAMKHIRQFSGARLWLSAGGLAVLAVVGLVPWRLVPQAVAAPLPAGPGVLLGPWVTNMPPHPRAAQRRKTPPQTGARERARPSLPSAHGPEPQPVKMASEGTGVPSARQAPPRGASRGVPSETVSAAIDFTDVFNRARSPDVLARQAAARELEAAKPAGPNARVMGLLDEMLRKDDDHFVRASAVRALERWGGRDGVPIIVRTLDDPHFAVQWAAIDVLAHLKDPRGIEPLAHDIVVNKNRAFASGALQTIGPASEGAALRLLGDHDGWVRLEGCKILKAVGSRTAIPALERLAAHDTDGLVVMGARDAIRTIEERK